MSPFNSVTKMEHSIARLNLIILLDFCIKLLRAHENLIFHQYQPPTSFYKPELSILDSAIELSAGMSLLYEIIFVGVCFHGIFTELFNIFDVAFLSAFKTSSGFLPSHMGCYHPHQLELLC